MREAASGRRGGVNLSSILRFATGSEEEPALGFSIHPSIAFVETPSFLPTSNTCINRLNITIPTEENSIPEAKLLYNLFDLAFSNTYFGLK
ncbi:hypothetical protein KUTeg_018764 [Tegillarca granosa]|uniref:HECT domain-containing protein n=1 Tax=Tegillarca granosa TaxID=220873 RepID=A0ABQ9EEB7_TEGGR|nr:hypothetical protein KUTeg_018764 [Tegillarca granosa]